MPTSAADGTGGDALVAVLERHGVELVFGIPGTHNLPIYRALGRSGIRHVAMRHEQGLAYAADGYARRSGRPGVVITTTGPALLNTAAAAAQAWSDSVPLLIVSPGMPRRHPAASTGHLHEVPDAVRAMEGAAGRSVRVETHRELVREVTDAFTAFRGRRPRPVHVEVPLDLLGEHGSFAVPPVPALPEPGVAAAPVAAAAALLAAADRAVIVAGGGAVGATEALQRLAERLGSLVVTSMNGKAVVDEEHPLALGATLHVQATHEVLAGADVVLAVGTELAESDLWGPLPALRGKLIRLDLDPSQSHGNVTCDVPIVGDARAGLCALDTALDGAGVPAGRAEPRPWHAPARQRIRAEASGLAEPWEPWIAALGDALPAGATVVGDLTMACYYGMARTLPLAPPARLLYPSGLGTLGYAVPAAVGAALADPPGPVVAWCGDGGLMFTVAELAAAAQLGLALPIIVTVNQGWGQIRNVMEDAGFAPAAVTFPPPDLPLLARSLGGHGTVLRDPAELAPALRAALGADRPTLIAIPEPPDASSLRSDRTEPT